MDTGAQCPGVFSFFYCRPGSILRTFVYYTIIESKVRTLAVSSDKMAKDVRTRLKEIALRGGKYFTGTARLFLASGTEVVNTELPTIGAMLDTNKDLLNDTIRFLRNPVDTVNRSVDKAMGSDNFKALQKFARNALDDLKTGNLYDPNRDRTAFGEGIDALLDNFGDFDMTGFDDSGEYTDTETDPSIAADVKIAEQQEENADKRTSATIEAIGTATNAIVATENANAQTNIRLSLKQHSQLMGGMTNMVTQQAATLQAVNSFASSILEVNREAHQQVMSSMKQITDLLTEIRNNTAPKAAPKFETPQEDEIIGTHGQLDIKKWLKQARKNADERYGLSSAISMATGGLDMKTMLELAGDNPWQLVTDQIVRNMIPDFLKQTMEMSSKYMENFFPALLSKFAERGRRFERPAEEGGGKLLDFVMGILGVAPKSRSGIDIAMKDPSNPGQITNRTIHAIEQVIPMWLSRIYSAVSGEGLQMYNYGTGKLEKVSTIISRETHSANDLAGRMGTGAYEFRRRGESIRFRDPKIDDDFQNYLYRWLQSQAEHNYFITPTKDRAQFLEEMPDTDRKELYANAIQAILKTMPRHQIMSMAAEISSARTGRNRANASINNALRENGITIAFSGMMDEDIQSALESKTVQKRYGLSAEDEEKILKENKARIIRNGGVGATNILSRDILNTLQRGIITYTYIMGTGADGAGAGLPEHIKTMYREAQENADTVGDRLTRLRNIERDNTIRTEENERSRRDKRAQEIANSRGDTADFVIDSETPIENIIESQKKLIINAIRANESDNPRVESTRRLISNYSGKLSSRLGIGNASDAFKRVKGFITEEPFKLMDSGLRTIDAFMFKLVYGEDAEDVLNGSEEIPSLMRTLKETIKANWLDAKDWFAENIGKPVKEFLFDRENGIFPKVKERFAEKIGKPLKERAGRIRDSIIGTKEVDADGNPTGRYVGGRFSEGINKVRDRFRTARYGMSEDVGSIIRNALNRIMYGDYVNGKGMTSELAPDGEGRWVAHNKYGGIVGRVKQSFESIRTVLFGDGSDPNDKSYEKFQLVSNELKENYPNMIIGGGLGLVGSFFLPGGPIFGMLLGSGAGLVAGSDRLKNYLFGESVDEPVTDKNGNPVIDPKTGKPKMKKSRSGGLIEKEVYDAWAKYLPAGAKGAGIGLIGSLFLPGGPLMGSVIGSLGGMALANDQFREMLFGNSIDPKSGLISKEFRDKVKNVIKDKAPTTIGGAALGAGAWSLISSLGIIPGLSLLPGGPIFGFIGGLLGATQADRIKEFFFGKPEEEQVIGPDGKPTGETRKVHKGGLFGKAFDFTRSKIIEPAAKKFNEITHSIGEWFQKDIITPFNNALEPMKKQIGNGLKRAGESLQNIGDKIMDSIDKIFEKNVGKPMGDFFEERILKPLRDATNKIFNAIGRAIGNIVSAPFKALEFMFSPDTFREAQDEKRRESQDKRRAERDARRAERTQRGRETLQTIGDRLRGMFSRVAGGEYATGERRESFLSRMAGHVRQFGSDIRDSMNNRQDRTQRAETDAASDERQRMREEEARRRSERDAQSTTGSEANTREEEERRKRSSDERDKIKEREESRKAEKEKKDKERADKAKAREDAKASGEGSSAGSRSRRKSNKTDNDYLKDISSHTRSIPKIYDEIKGQLGGTGWNVAYIKTLLDKQFGKLGDEELPEEMEGSKKVKKRRTIFGRIYDRVTGMMDGVIGGIRDTVGRVVDTIMHPFRLIGKAVGAVKDAIAGAASTLWDITKTIGSAIGDVLKGAAKGIGEVLAGAGRMIHAAAAGIGSAIGDVVSTLTGVLKDGILATSAVVRGLVETAADIAPDLARMAWDGMKFVGRTVGKGVKFLASGAAGGVKWLFDKVTGRDKNSKDPKKITRIGKVVLDGGYLDEIKKLIPMGIGDTTSLIPFPYVTVLKGLARRASNHAIPVYILGIDKDAKFSDDNGPDETSPESSPNKSANPEGTNAAPQTAQAVPLGPGNVPLALPPHQDQNQVSNPQADAANRTVTELRNGFGQLAQTFGKTVGEAKDKAAAKLREWKRAYTKVDRRAEHASSPSQAYDQAISNAQSENELDAIMAAQQMNANNALIPVQGEEKEEGSGILGMLLGLLGKGILGKLGTWFAGTKIGKLLLGAKGAAGTATKGFLKGTLLPAGLELAGGAANAYQLFGEEGNALWGVQNITNDAISIGKTARAMASGVEDAGKNVGPIKKAISKVISSLMNNGTVKKMFGALSGKMTAVAGKLVDFISTKVLGKVLREGGEAVVKSSIKQIAAFATGGLLAVGFAIVDFISGFGNAKKYFKVFGSDVSLGMRLTSAIVNTLGGLLGLIPGVGALLSVAAAMFQDQIVQLVYGLLADDAAKQELAQNQAELEAATAQYNAENGTDYTVEEYASKFNADGSKRNIFTTIGGGIVSGVKAVGGAVVGGVKKVGSMAVGAVKGVGNFIGGVGDFIGNGVQTVGQKLNEFVTNLPEMVSNGITGLFNKIGDVLYNLPTMIGKGIANVVGGIIKTAGGIGKMFINMGKGIINFIIGDSEAGKEGLIQKLISGIGNMFVAGIKLVLNTPQILFNLVTGLGKGIINALGAAIGGVGNLIKEIVSGIGQAIADAVGGVAGAVDSAVESIPVVGTAYKGVKKVGGAVVDFVSTPFKAIGGLFGGGPGNETATTTPTNQMAGVLKNTVTTLQDILAPGSSFVTNLISGIANRITNSGAAAATTAMAGPIGSPVSAIANGVKTLVTDPKQFAENMLNTGYGIGKSLIDMMQSIFKDKTKLPNIFGIIGQGLGTSLLDDLRQVEGKNSTVSTALGTAISTATGGDGKQSFLSKIASGIKGIAGKVVGGVANFLGFGKGPADDTNTTNGIPEEWGTGKVTPMSQSAGKWNRGSNAMAKTGCGPTAAAMVASAYGAKGANPAEANAMSYQTGMRATDGGTNPNFFGKYASAHGYGMAQGPVDANTISGNLAKGQPVVLMGRGGAYGKSMHYMVADRTTGRDGVGIVDPLTGSRKSTTMDGLLRNTQTAVYSYGKGPADDTNTTNGMTTAEAQQALVNKMASIQGQLKYSLDWDKQNPDIGYASCASTVGWAYKKVLGVDGMSANSGTQSKDSRFSTIWVNNGTPLDTSILQPGDVLYQNWKQTKNNGSMSHTEMYAGNNQDLSHGGGSDGTEMGPTYKNLNDYRRQHTMMVRRYTPFVDGSTVSVYDTSSGISATNNGSTSTSGTTTTNADGTTTENQSLGDSVLSGLSSIFTGMSNKMDSLLSALMGQSSETTEDGTTSTDAGNTTETGSTTATPTSNVSFTGNVPTYTTTESSSRIYQFLRSKGYTPIGASGIMGCWQNESANRADRLEGDYLGSFPGFEKAMASNASLNDYTENVLFPAYARSNISINKGAYKGSDGNYYPGIGLAQWTGPRGYELLQHAKSIGGDWRDLDTQLLFYSKEADNRGLKEKLNAATSPADAARVALDNYEMYSGWSNTATGKKQLAARSASAQSIYNTYGANDNGTTGTSTSGTTATTALGPGWGKGSADLGINREMLDEQIRNINRIMRTTREDAETDDTVTKLTKTITSVMSGDADSNKPGEYSGTLQAIAGSLATMIELLTKVVKNTEPDETDTASDINSKNNIPTARPTYPNGVNSPDDVGAITVNRLTSI